MANNEILIRVRVDDKGRLVEATNQTRKLREEADKTTRAQTKLGQAAERAGQSTSSVNHAKNARDMKGLRDQIGSGNNGLVGAYATLAVNTFAVVAAFSALQKATGALKIMAGLEAQSGRLGRTLSLTAGNIREITQDAVSMTDAMRATAQLTAGGFGQEQIQGLTLVAKNASAALGRDLADSMDRLSRGVTKLEPELLDELGIMTKLDEASNLYATANNKTAASLTSVEKRQAFMNAVLAEGDRKFAGIGESVGEYDAYTRLAATATDLFVDTVGGIAMAFSPVVELFASSKGLIAGALILYAATIKDDLIPALTMATEKQKELAAIKGSNLAAQARSFAEQADIMEKAQRKNGATTGRFLPRAGAKELAALATVAEDGTVSLGDFRRAHLALTAQLENADDILMRAAENTEDYNIALANRGVLEDAQRNVRALTSAYYEQQAAQKAGNVLNTAQNVTISNLGESFRSMRADLRGQFDDLQQATQPLEQATTRTARAQQALGVAASTVGNGLTVAATGARAFGIMALNALPAIGQLIMVLSLLQLAYEAIRDALTTEEQAHFNKVQEEYNTIIEAAAEKQRNFNRFMEQAAGNSKAQVDALKLTGNAITEVTTKFLEMAQARREADASSLFGDSEKLGEARSRVEDMRWSGYAVVGTDDYENLELYREGLNTVSAAMGAMNEQQKASTLARLEDIHSIEDYSERVVQQEKFIKEISETYKQLATATENVQETFKNLEDATTKFIQSASISTPVDKLAESLTAATTSAAEMRIELMKGSTSVVEVGRAFAASLGPQSRNMLGADLGIVLELEQAQSTIKTLQASYDELNANQRAELSRALIKEQQISASLVETVIRRLEATKNLVRQAQSNYRLAKDQAALEDARYNRAKDLLQVGAQGYLAREEHEEKVRAAQVSQLDIQQTILEIMQTQARASLQQLETKRADLAIQLQNLEALREATELEKLGYRLRAGIVEMFETVATSDSVNEKRARALQIQIAQLDVSISAAKDGMNELGDSIQSLETQKATVLQQNLSAAEKAARAAGAEFEVSKKFFEQLSTYADAIHQTNKGIRDFNLLISGSNNEIQRQLLNITETYDEQRTKLIRQLAVKAGQLNVDMKILDTNRDGVALTEQESKAAQQSLDVAQAEYQNEYKITEQLLQQAEVQMRLQALQLAIYDTRKEGIEWQKEALNLIEKEAELTASNLAANLQISATRRANARRERGLPQTEDNSRAEALRSAAETLRAAKEAAGIRINAINAEYALLEAQKVMLEQELISRRQILSLQEGVSAAYLEPLDNAISMLQGINTGNMRDAAIRGVALDIDQKTQNVRAAKLEATMKRTIGEDSYLGRILTRAMDRQSISEAVVDADSAIAQATSEAAKLVIADNNSGIKALERVSGQQLAPILTPIERVADDVRAIREHVTGGGASGPLGSILDVHNDAQRRGIRSSELNAQTGHTGAGHKEGRAVDLNIGTGNIEANIPSMKARFDALAKEYQSKGFVVLWNHERYAPGGGTSRLSGNPHTDHMHVESPSVRIDPRVSTTTAVAEASATGAQGASPAQIGAYENALDKRLPNASGPYANAAASMPNSTTTASSATSEPIEVVAKRGAKFQETMVSMAESSRYFKEEFEFAMEPLYTLAQKLGPDGELIVAISDGVTGMTSQLQETFTILSQAPIGSTAGITSMLAVASQAVSTISSILAASSQQKIRGIEAEIAAEQKRDGQSAASLAKIAEMEKRKDSIARKQFNTNKKMMMAQAVIATATGVTQALSLPWPMNLIMAGVIGAMGAAQLAIIAGTTYQGGSNTQAGKISIPKMSIGRVGDKVNLDRSNTSAGGEIGYLRGSAGYGTNASNYMTIGSATGGSSQRGYGHRSFLVGERGPETLETDTGMNIRPIEEKPVKEGDHYYIQATDADSFVRMLENNPEAIIKGVRKVANSNGTPFLESVDLKGFKATKR